MKQMAEKLISLLTWTANVSDTESNNVIYNIDNKINVADLKSNRADKELVEALNSNLLDQTQYQLIESYKNLTHKEDELLAQLAKTAQEIKELRYNKKYPLIKDIIKELQKVK